MRLEDELNATQEGNDQVRLWVLIIFLPHTELTSHVILSNLKNRELVIKMVTVTLVRVKQRSTHRISRMG